MNHIEPLPPPVHDESVGVWQQIIADMQARDQWGRTKYGTALQVDNGRIGLIDLFQELLDALVYTKQAILQSEQGVIVETEHSLAAMTQAIAKRTQSGIMRSAAERDALIDLYQEVSRALGLFRIKG